MASRNPLYIVVFRASLHVQMIPSELDLLWGMPEPGGTARPKNALLPFCWWIS
jgi:hypothetical protein